MLNAMALTLCRPLSPKRQKLSRRTRCDSPPPSASSKSTLPPRARFALELDVWLTGDDERSQRHLEGIGQQVGASAAKAAGEPSSRAAAPAPAAREPNVCARGFDVFWHIVKAFGSRFCLELLAIASPLRCIINPFLQQAFRRAGRIGALVREASVIMPQDGRRFVHTTRAARLNESAQAGRAPPREPSMSRVIPDHTSS